MEPLKHGEKIIDGIVIKYICQPCPECQAKLKQYESWQVQMSGVLAFYEQQKDKLKAAEEMGRALDRVKREDTGQLTAACYGAVQAALSVWEQAGKGIQETQEEEGEEKKKGIL